MLSSASRIKLSIADPAVLCAAPCRVVANRRAMHRRVPTPIQADISIVLGLAHGGAAVAEKHLKTRIADAVVATDVHERCGFRLRRGNSLGSVGKDLRAERQLLAEVALE